MKDSFSGKMIVWWYLLNSAILPLSEFSWNLKQLYKDSKKEIEKDPELANWYLLANYIKSEKEIDTIVSNIKKGILLDSSYLRFLDAGINATHFQEELWDNWYSLTSNFSVLQWWEIVATYKWTDKSITWVQKLYWWDAPGYYIQRLKIIGDKILFQQSELVPYQILYKGWLDQKTFDANLKSAIAKGFVFKTPAMNKRYKFISTYFNSHETKLTKKVSNKILSKNYKIENNIIKYLSTWVGDSQYIITDIDPNTVKIFSNEYSWVDKDGPFVDSMRLLWWDKTFYTLFKWSSAYWGKYWTDKVFSYSNNEKWLLIEIPEASIKTIKFKYTDFSSKSSLCKADDNSYYFYDTYDDNYCYWKSSNQDGVKKLWTIISIK